MDKKSPEFSENSVEISKRENLFEKGEGVSYSKIPRKLINLRAVYKASLADTVVAIALADYSSRSLHYPNFSVEQAEIASITGLSKRQVITSIKNLTLNRVLSVRSTMGFANQYTWNEYFLRTGEIISQGDVKTVHTPSENRSQVGCENSAHIYIEVLLNLFIDKHKEFFATNQKPYRFYVPAKKSKKGAPKEVGAVVEVSRAKAWEDAIRNCFSQIYHRKDALTRIYLALMSSYKIEKVTFPKSFLLHGAMNEGIQHESRKLSQISYCLDNDEEFINEFLSHKGVKQ